MNVLITGASSLLGKSLLQSAPACHSVAGTWYTNCQPGLLQMDICDMSQVRYVFQRVQPKAVIHMASVGDVDFCETSYQEAYRVNVEGTNNVLKVAREHGARVIYPSSNAVFDGDHPPYAKDSERNPVNRYGTMRAYAEDMVGKEINPVIARLFLLYGWEPTGARGNWASKLVKQLEEDQEVRLVDDRWYMPTYAPHAARALWKMVDGPGGVYHVAGKDRVSLYEFGIALAETFSFDPDLVKPCKFQALKGLAPRPVDTTYVLDVELPGINAGLRSMITGMVLDD